MTTGNHNAPSFVVDYAKLGETAKPRRLHHDKPNQCSHLDRDQPMRPATPDELRNIPVCNSCARR
jgi:hypothetical protein